MRCLERNKSPFFYALYMGREAVQDECGNVTGEYRVVYGKPRECRANISAAQGESLAQQFGYALEYDKVIVMDKDFPPIDEYSVLWVDTMPALDCDGELAADEKGKLITPHDYIVRKVARSLNYVAFAISKVQVS